MTGAPAILTASDIAAAAVDFRHPLQEEARCRVAGLTRITGLSATSVNLVTVPPATQAFPLHRHHVEEEWLYVVSGEADVTLEAESHRVGAGGFVAFAAGGPAHAVRNASGADPLVCLMGGSAVDADVIDFPQQEKRIVRTRRDLGACEIAGAEAFSAFDFFSRTPRPEGDG